MEYITIKATRLVKILKQEIDRSVNSNTEFGCKSLGRRLRFAQREVRTKSLGNGKAAAVAASLKGKYALMSYIHMNKNRLIYR